MKAPVGRRSAVRFLGLGSAALLGCGAVGMGCAQPVQPAPPPVEFTRADWTFAGARGAEIVTPHYKVRTTCLDDRLLAALPEFLESCWSGYESIVPAARPSGDPALCYLFQTRAQWEQFTRTFSPARARTYLLIRSGGYEERGVTVSHYDRMVTTFAVLAHEGLHQYLSVTRGGRLPAWVNEGLACYFEAYDLARSGRATFRPRDNLIRRNNLREASYNRQFFELKELLSTDAGRVVALPSARVRTYYAQAWSVVLFLLERDPQTDPGAAGFRRLLDDLGSEHMVREARLAATRLGAPDMELGEAVFRAYVSDDLKHFQSRYEAFVAELLRL